MQAGENRIGLIGLGLVGSAMAGRLMKARFEVIGFDVAEAALSAFADLGGIPAGGSADVAGKTRRILLSLPDGDVVRRVVNELVSAIEPGSLIIDTTTAGPTEVEAIAALLGSVQAGYVDATISGSSEVVAAGQATWLVGGSPGDIQAAMPTFAAIGGMVHHLGPVGAGTRAKLVSNLILGLNRAALAEGLALAEAWGMDLPATLAALQSSAAYSRVMDAKGTKMITRDYAPQARLRQHHKDVRLILGTARETGQILPMTQLHDRLLDAAEGAGWGDQDNSAIIEIWRRSAGGPRAEGSKRPDSSDERTWKT